jgi:hypothetical protein
MTPKASKNPPPQTELSTDRLGERPANASRFEDVADAVFDAVSEGFTLTEAASTVGISVNTVRNWIQAGRQRPDGPYGAWVAALDAVRAAGAVDDDDEGDDERVGPVEGRVEALINGRELDPEGEVHAAQARALARTVDALSQTRTGSAGMALASVSRRLEECIAHLELRPKDAVTELQERHRQRLLRMVGPDHYLLQADGAGSPL